MDEPTSLSEKERQLVAHLELEWFLRGHQPTPETLCEKFDYTPRALMQTLEKEIVQKSLKGRGVPVTEGRELTAEQITMINIMLNTTDTRSQKKKLADAGVSAATWAGWRKKPAVQEYLRTRAEQILGESIPDAHLALVDRVNSGDLGALKFYYEITGRYTGQSGGLDPKVLVTRVFDVIAKHIQDPTILNAISQEFMALVNLDQAARVGSGDVVSGEITKGF